MPGRIVALLTAGFLAVAAAAAAQELPSGADTGQLVRHKPLSGMPFPKASAEDKFIDTGMIYRLPQPSRSEKIKDLPRHNNYLVELPRCRESATRRREIFQYTVQTASYDMTFYDPNDREQVIGVRSVEGKAVPYKGGRMARIDKDINDVFQLLAMPLDIRCLPTRFRFVLEDNHRYIEHREGRDAWKKTAASAK